MRSLAPRAGPLAILDFLLLIGCYALTTYLWAGSGGVTYLFYENGLAADVLTAGAVLVLLYFQRLYDYRRLRVNVDLILRLVSVMGVAFLLQASVAYLQRDLALPLLPMIAGSAIAFAVLTLNRFIYSGALSGSFGVEHILLVGATPLNRAIASRILARPDLGYSVVGFLDDTVAPETDLEGARVLGPTSALAEIRRGLPSHRAVADFSGVGAPLSLVGGYAIPGSLEKPDALYELLFGRVCGIEPADVLFGGRFEPSRPRMVLQAVYTNLLALAALVVVSPLLVAIAVLIRTFHGSPVLEGQLTAGWRLISFTRFRFRCHEIVKTAGGESLQLTVLGAWLQRLRLQHLPQLLNVLRGEMVLAGPPPLRVEFADALVEALPAYRLAYAAKPGLVSWSALNKAEDALTALEYELYYIKSMSPPQDLSMFLEALSRPVRQPAAGR